MKRLYALVLTLSLFSAGAALADKPVPLRVGASDTLYVYDLQGNPAATLPAGTIAKQIDVPPYSFQVSYGRDADGNISVIVAPNPENPTPLDFTLNGRDVQVNATGVATLTVANNGQVSVQGGSLGGVLVDGQKPAAQTPSAPFSATITSPSTPASQNAGTPAAPAAAATQIATPDSILATFAPSPNLLPGATNQQPDVFPAVAPVESTYGAEGEDPTLPPAALPPTSDVRTNPSAIINGSTGNPITSDGSTHITTPGQPIVIPTGPPPTTPI